MGMAKEYYLDLDNAKLSVHRKRRGYWCWSLSWDDRSHSPLFNWEPSSLSAKRACLAWYQTFRAHDGLPYPKRVRWMKGERPKVGED